MTTENCAVIQPITGNSFVSISTVMSKINHRLYRQTRKYFADVKIHNPQATGIKLHVYVLNNTWMMQNAVKFARAAYEKAVKEEKKTLKGQLARWHDFRLNLNPSDGAGFSGAFTEKHPLFINMDTVGATALTAGDFVNSVARDEDSNVGYTFGLWEGGNQYNILKEYEMSASTEDSPDDIETTMPYDAIDDEAQTTTFVELQQQGNEPPYNKDNMNDLQLFRHVGTLFTNSNGNQKLSTGVICAPLGLIVLIPDSEVPGEVCLHMKKGSYKGLASEAMS